MLAEKPNPALLAWWRWYTRHALRKHFHRIMLYGDWSPPPSVSPASEPAAGTLYLANHVSFWDGIVLFELLRRRCGESALRCMIDETQVRKHRFFRAVGGFSVNRASPRDGLRAVEHTAALLHRGHGVVLFPQGGIRPAESPLTLERGFTYVLDRAPGARLRVVVLRYEFWENQRPEVMAWSGGLLTPSATVHVGQNDVLSLFRQGLSELRDATIARAPGEVFLTGRKSIADWQFGRVRPAEQSPGPAAQPAAPPTSPPTPRPTPGSTSVR